MNRVIEVKVTGQCMAVSNLHTVNGTVNIIECNIEMNDWWTAFPALRAIFMNDNDGKEYNADIIAGKCTVPHEVLRKAGKVYMAIEGQNATQVERSESQVIVIQKKTLQGGINSIDPTPDQYTEFIERAGEAIEDYFNEHKEEFKGDPGDPGEPGEPGKDGDDYVITPADYEAIGNIVKGELQPLIDKKMEYYAVTIENGKLVHKGTIQTYEDILNAFNNESVFLYLSYLNLIFIPSFVVAGHEEEGRDAVEFASAYYYAEEPTISRVIINSADQIKYNQIALENTEWKIDDLEGWTVGEYPQAYPTADAVATQLTDVRESFNQLDGDVENVKKDLRSLGLVVENNMLCVEMEG